MKPEIVVYRLERSSEALEDAALLISKNRMTAAVNRMYYCVFYAATALLETKDLSSSKHSGIRSLFNQQFVKPGIISTESGDTYNALFKDRSKGDYSDFVEFTAEQVAGYFDACKKCSDEIKTKALELLNAGT